MRKIQSALAAALAIGMAAPASAAVGDPEVIIYRASGVRDTGGGAFTGLATAFHCTNFSGVSESIRFVVRNTTGALLANQAVTVPHLNTVTVATKEIGSYLITNNLNTNPIEQGTAAIAATSINVTCTVWVVQANITTPEGIALHMTRFNPAPGTQE
jgi:hypothetical protein